MNQFDQPSHSPEETREQKKAKYIILARELNEVREGFPFPGINEESYDRLKEVAEKYPDYTAPIDEIIERCKAQGIKVVLGKNPNSGNVFIMPFGSDNIEMDNLFPRHLKIIAEMDEKLKKLILLNQELKSISFY
ncbi:MAG: hypothetical protein AAB595_00560 [Patescibacteria group bacterium]